MNKFLDSTGLLDFFALFTAVGIPVMISLALKYYFYKREFKEKRQFIRSFVTQKTVNLVIKDQAIHLQSLFDEQIKSQTRSSGASVDKRDEMVRSAAESIAVEKKKFWDLVGMARIQGFRVPETIDETLDLHEQMSEI
ncbi:MAG: hypothetical protein WAV25_00025 [Minisyncoccia bacterium]